MAGLRGNTAWWMFQKQTSKGTPAVPALGTCYKVPFSGGDISPERVINQLAETDASRDQGVSFAVSGGSGGSPECYARDDSIGALLFYCLGTDVVTGTPPNSVHTETPNNTIPYVTFWRDLGDVLWEQYSDCFLSDLNIKTAAGQPMTAAATIMGLASTRLTTDPSVSAAIPLNSSYVYNYNDCTVTLAGGATALVSSFDITIANGVTRQQTDDFVPYDVVVGQRQVSMSFDIIFETLSEYNKFNYGSPTGTTQGRTLYTTSADFQFDNGANNQVKFTVPNLAYTTFPVTSNVAGSPIVATVSAVAQRPVSGPIMTAVVRNQVSSY